MKKIKRIENISIKCPVCGYANSYQIVKYGIGREQEITIEKDICKRCKQHLLPKNKSFVD